MPEANDTYANSNIHSQINSLIYNLSLKQVPQRLIFNKREATIVHMPGQNTDHSSASVMCERR